MAGAVLMVVVFTTSLLLATIGAALMRIGMAAWAPRAETAARRTTGFLAGGWTGTTVPADLCRTTRVDVSAE